MRCSSFEARAIGIGISLVHLDPAEHHCNWNLDHLNNPPISTVLNSFVKPKTPLSMNLEKGTGSGDIKTRENLEKLRARVILCLESEPVETSQSCSKDLFVSLVTADGGADFHKSFIEEQAMPLLLCQIIAMVQNLQTGGNFVLKIFSMQKVCEMFLSTLDAFSA